MGGDSRVWRDFVVMNGEINNGHGNGIEPLVTANSLWTGIDGPAIGHELPNFKLARFHLQLLNY